MPQRPKLFAATKVWTTGREQGNAQMEESTRRMHVERFDLIAVHKESANIRLENQKSAASPIPFHPGAAKYLAEKGVKLN